MKDLVRIAHVLDRAADLIEPKGAWGQASGKANGDHCAATAIDQVTGLKEGRVARKFFAEFLGVRSATGGIWDWNDAPERTQSEVVAKLRLAASKAREGLDGGAILFEEQGK